MGRTSIACSDETHEIVSKQKRDGESWDDCLQRLTEGTDDDTSKKLQAILDKLDTIEAKIERFESTGESVAVSMNEIREGVRQEVRDQLKNFLQ